MRFRAVHLTRFGCFTEQSLEFGPPSDTPDFHIVYGDNEAGKSTLRDAITAFLYGIPARTEYNFLHDYRALQIGAELDLDDRTLCATRIKANRESLRSPDDAVVDEEILARELLGLSETEFINLFSLDLRALLEGGSDILQAKGDLGALLFAGASGISSISQTIDQARTKANGFFKPRASSSQLAQMKKRLNDIDSELKLLDVHAPELKRLKRAAAEAERAYDEAERVLKVNRASYEAQNHIIQALDPWRELCDLQTRLAQFGELPAADEDALDRARVLQTELRALQELKSDLERDVARAEERLKSLRPPAYRDRLFAGLENLQVDELAARASTARLDLPSRRSELEDLHRQISSTLERLELDPNSDPETHLVSKANAARIVALADKGETLAAENASAAIELETAASAFSSAREDLSDLPEPRDFAPLEDALTTYRRDLDIDQVHNLETELASAMSRLDRAIRGLAPWNGAAEDLAKLAVPGTSDLEVLQKRQDDLRADLNRLQSEHKSLFRTVESDTAKLSELEADPDIVSDQEAAKLLEQRNKFWRDHTRSIEDGAIHDIKSSADAFEASMRRNDLAASKRLARAADLGEIKSRKLNRKGAQAECKLVEESISETTTALSDVHDEVSRIATSLRLPASTNITELRMWRQKRDHALDELAAHQDRVQALAARKSRRSNATSVLKSILEDAGIPNTDVSDTLFATSERALLTLRTEGENYNLAKAKCDTLERQSIQREATAKAAQLAYDAWQREWSETIAELSLEGDGRAEVKARLEDLADLSVKFDDYQKLERRISLMEASETEFSDVITQLADDTGLGDKEADVHSRFVALKAEANELQKQDVQLHAVEEQLDKDRAAFQSKADKLQALNDERQALCNRYGADDLTGCIVILKSASDAETLTDQAAALRRQISSFLGKNDETVWSDSLSPLIESPSALADAEAHLKSSKLQIDMEEERVRELYAEWKAAERLQHGIGADASAAQLQQSRTTLLEDIKRGTENYVSLKAGALIVDEAVRLFRDQHRGAMLRRASDAFSKMTLGRYPRLVTMTGDDREVLVAERLDKTTVSAESLSTGTRAQLYLALRIAGHAQYAKTQVPLPFIADDILEEFDDHRAKEALLLMTKMAETGQVIYLTHHQHLVDIALEAAAERCTIHRLGSTAPNLTKNLD
ncbi:MAG: AAA family ATPase [Henriciella sp.]